MCIPTALLAERIGANAGGNVERRIPPERVGKTERKDMKATAIRDHGRAWTGGAGRHANGRGFTNGQGRLAEIAG